LSVNGFREISEHPQTQAKGRDEQKQKREELKQLLDGKPPDKVGGLSVEIDFDVVRHISHLVTQSAYTRALALSRKCCYDADTPRIRQ